MVYRTEQTFIRQNNITSQYKHITTCNTKYLQANITVIYVNKLV